MGIVPNDRAEALQLLVHTLRCRGPASGPGLGCKPVLFEGVSDDIVHRVQRVYEVAIIYQAGVHGQSIVGGNEPRGIPQKTFGIPTVPCVRRRSPARTSTQWGGSTA